MKKKKKLHVLLKTLIVAIVLALAVFLTLFIDSRSNNIEREFTISEAQAIVDDAFSKIAPTTAVGTNYIFENSKIVVEDVSYGNERNAILSCSYTTLDSYNAIQSIKDTLFFDAYELQQSLIAQGKKPNATRIEIEIESKVLEAFESAEQKSGKIELNIYELADKSTMLHLSTEVVNTCTGGLFDAIELVDSIKEIDYNGERVDISSNNTLRTGIKQIFKFTNFSTSKPDTSTKLQMWINDFKDDFYRNFIQNAQWSYLTNGLLTTLEITGLSVLIGIFIGFLVAIIRCTYQTTGKLAAADGVCRLYLTIMRGTPVMVQLLIIYFVFLLPIGVEKFPAAVICFGLNSGAYVAEIVRGGIMSIDKGQTEAGRSLGFNYAQTMIFFVIPQAFKAVLPALANEFITLLKESSVAFYIGVADLTQGGLKIRSITYSNFMPLIAVALIYLTIVLILTKLVSILERRLSKSDH